MTSVAGAPDCHTHLTQKIYMGQPMKSCKHYYSKCSKIVNTFLFLFSNKILVIRAESHKMFVRIANREDPDQTASSEAV